MGIKEENLEVTDSALHKMIEEYTGEAGVRSLKKLIDILCRNAAVKLVKKEQETLTVTKENLSEFLGTSICAMKPDWRKRSRE